MKKGGYRRLFGDFPRNFASSNQLKLDKSTERRIGRREREVVKQKNSQYYFIRLFLYSVETRNIDQSSSIIQMKLIDFINPWIIWMIIGQMSGRESIAFFTQNQYIPHENIFIEEYHGH